MLNFALYLSLQGVRPQSFFKIEDEDVKYIIDWCTRLHNEER